MKKTFYIIALILGSIAAFLYWRNMNSSCHHDHGTVELKSEDNQVLLQEVMDIHDEVMPKMSYMTSLQSKLRHMAESTKDQALKDKYLSMSTELEKADEAMMVWMEQFPDKIDQYSTEEANRILNKEKEKVIKMKEQVLGAIKRAEDYFVENK